MNWSEIILAVLGILGPTAVGFWATVKWLQQWRIQGASGGR